MSESTVIVTSEKEIQKIVNNALQRFTNEIVVPLLNRTQQDANGLRKYKDVVDEGRYGSRAFLDSLRRSMSDKEEQRIFPKKEGMLYVVVPDLEDYLAGRKLKHDAMIKLDPRSKGVM